MDSATIGTLAGIVVTGIVASFCGFAWLINRMDTLHNQQTVARHALANKVQETIQGEVENLREDIKSLRDQVPNRPRRGGD